ncbi:VOC family protein [Knoellia sp. S7-12]|uniref:VOC family protein n=1 Tax=Knoellia sp. S7-12 TaxID=3126698 RepID=UPI003366DDDF
MTLDSPELREAVQPDPQNASARPAFAGIDHVALTVTDLDVSQRFYTEVLDFVVVMDVGTGRICMHPGTGFVLALLTHEGSRHEPFSELHVGADHLGLTAASREDLEAWEAHFAAHDVPYTPIRDETFGSHLNFRDPDNIALEFTSSNELMVAAQTAMKAAPMTADDIAAFVAENVSPDFVAGQVARMVTPDS